MPFQLRLNYTIHNKLQYMRHSVGITVESHVLHVYCLSFVFYVLYLEVLCLLELLHSRCAVSRANLSGLVVHAHGISSTSCLFG